VSEQERDPRAASIHDQVSYREILENVAEGVYFVDRDRRITFWNRAATEISGHPPETVVGHRCPNGPLQHIDGEGQLLCETGCPLSCTLADGNPRKADVFLRHRDGHRVPVRVAVRPIRSKAGEVIGAVETFTDLTPLREATRRAAQLERLAFIDVLTGIGNRQFAERQLESYLSQQDRHGRGFGLLLLDIDGFKAINDTHGHEAGDAVLRMLGRTLAAAARAEDFVARWGGDEFLVLVREGTAANLEAAGQRIRRMTAASAVTVNGTEIRVTVSIGGVVAKPGESAPDLLRRADTLLYQSKGEGRDRLTVSE
jgi:diguanylate cyclase (GGDEF)-like protein/PAS domain S-box-containing protein